MCERAQLHQACKRVKHQSYRSEVLSGVVRGSNSSDSGLAADHSSGETVSTGRSGSSSLSRETSVEVLSSASENSERRDRSELSRESEDRVTVIQEMDELDDLIEGGDQNEQVESEVCDRGTGRRDTYEGDRGLGSVTVSRDRVNTRREERSTGRVGSDNEEDEDNGVLSNSEMRRIIKVFMRHTMSTADTTTMAGDQTRKVQGLAHHRDGVDIAKYIAKLEADLKDIGVCQRDFKAILFQKLSSKSTSQIVATFDRDDCTYDELKQTLIDSLGSGRTCLGNKLISNFLADTKHMDPLQTYVHLKGLMDSVNMTIGDRKDVLLFFATAIYRHGLTSQQRAVMDSREIVTFKELNRLAISLQTTDSDTRDRVRDGKRIHYHGSIKCFKCQGYGHRSFECRTGRVEVKSNVVCYSCNQNGHKANECPTKTEQQSSKHATKTDSAPKSLTIKPGSRPRNANMVADGTDYPLIDGKVNGLACKFAPDTGAQITVVPDNLVFQDQVLGDTVVLRFGNGELERFPMAEVELQAESEPYRRKVAVAPVDMLRGTVLYSVPMDVAMARKLLRDAAGLSRVRDVLKGLSTLTTLRRTNHGLPV